MVRVVEGREVEEGLGTDAGAQAAPAGSGQIICAVGENIGSAYALKLKWEGQETAEAISALCGICVRVFYSGLRCLPASLPCTAPARSCCAFCLLLLLAAHPYSVSPGCFLERRKSEHAGDFFWNNCSLVWKRGKCSTCSAISTLVLWKAW